MSSKQVSTEASYGCGFGDGRGQRFGGRPEGCGKAVGPAKIVVAPPIKWAYIQNVTTKEIYLDQGSHETYEDGHCLLEVAAHLAGEPHSDTPACVCPVLAAAGRGLNDSINDGARRQALLGGLAPALVNTLDPSKEHQRSLEWLDWLTRVYLPTWLDLVPSLAAHAAALRGLPAVSDENAVEAEAVVCAAAAAGEAVRDAAWDTAWVAIRDAVWGAAVGAAWTTAWSAQQFSMRDAAWEAARSAAVAAAWSAAREAARDATWVGTGDVAEALLGPTTEALQDSAAALLRRQCGL